MRVRSAAAVAGALLGAATWLVPAHAEPTRSQTFFRSQILADNATSEEVVDLLRGGGGFVDKQITFADLTGDGRQDAVVRVQSGSAAGILAVYIFTTDGQNQSDTLRVRFRRQRLVRASTRVRSRRLSYRTRSYAAGDELCCPTVTMEHDVRWDDERGRFRVGPAEDVSDTRAG